MQALIEWLAGLIALLAAAALAQFGVDLKPAGAPDREVHRVGDCARPAPASLVGGEPPADC